MKIAGDVEIEEVQDIKVVRELSTMGWIVLVALSIAFVFTLWQTGQNKDSIQDFQNRLQVVGGP